MLAEAKSEIENYGPTLVEKGMEKSGRAIALLQQSGLAELGPFIDAWSRLEAARLPLDVEQYPQALDRRALDQGDGSAGSGAVRARE